LRLGRRERGARRTRLFLRLAETHLTNQEEGVTKSRHRYVIVTTLAVLVAVVAAGAAFAWSQTYVSGATFSAGQGNRSGYNSNLKGNALSFDNRYGGSPQMCSEYVDSNGVPENSPVCHPSSFTDWRTTSYGAANCHADIGNSYSVYVSQCYTNN
jgi:hypothetical protein